RVVLAVQPELVGDRLPAEVRHADDLDRRGGVDRVDRDDVGVLEAGEPLRLAVGPEGDLQGPLPAGEHLPGGEGDPGERPAARAAGVVTVVSRSDGTLL